MNISGEAKALIGIGLATVLILIGGIFFLTKTNPPEATVKPGEKVDRSKLVKPDSYKIGTDSAKVTVIEFIDFECEACGAAHPIVKQILDEYKGKIQFVVRNFPNHKNSILAANFAEAAGEQGKFWEMHDKLFQNQKEWGEKQTPQKELFLKYARELGLDMEKLTATVDSNKFTGKINRDKQEGISIGVDATPTFYINGVKEVGVLPYDQFKQKIDAELNK